MTAFRRCNKTMNWDFLQADDCSTWQGASYLDSIEAEEAKRLAEDVCVQAEEDNSTIGALHESDEEPNYSECTAPSVKIQGPDTAYQEIMVEDATASHELSSSAREIEGWLRKIDCAADLQALLQVSSFASFWPFAYPP